ncbi:MAG: GatB/YqeY domain-containing protein [Candidatus Margulisbacteria bacterium]|nr:GatB/YqeY domain-containing protein [Candidatus Margulisiibacteriota bacterium]
MTIFEKINQDIKESMKAQNKKKLDVLRMIKSKIMNVEARGNLPDPEIIKIISTYEKNLKDALEQAQKNNRTDIADELKAEMVIVAEYLPQKLSEANTRELIIKIIKETGAVSMKDMGKVMKALMSGGQTIDGGLAKSIIEEQLKVQ